MVTLQLFAAASVHKPAKVTWSGDPPLSKELLALLEDSSAGETGVPTPDELVSEIVDVKEAVFQKRVEFCVNKEAVADAEKTRKQLQAARKKLER
jgi:hypothetical protein